VYEKLIKDYCNALPAIEKETGRESREDRMLPSGGYPIRLEAVS